MTEKEMAMACFEPLTKREMLLEESCLEGPHWASYCFQGLPLNPEGASKGTTQTLF
jgi:hypothetical protein